jgi:hypothetical protein
MHKKCPFARGRTDHEQPILQHCMDTSKDERIAARRLRIQQKLATKQGAGASGSTGAAMIIHEKTDVRIGELLHAFACFVRCHFLCITLSVASQVRPRSQKVSTGCGGC